MKKFPGVTQLRGDLNVVLFSVVIKRRCEEHVRAQAFVHCHKKQRYCHTNTGLAEAKKNQIIYIYI